MEESKKYVIKRMIILKRTNNSDKDFLWLVAKLDKDLADRYGAMQKVYDQYNKIENLDTVVVAYDLDIVAGCGCFKRFDDDSVEVKRMYVNSEMRGHGIGREILTELEKWAAELGYKSTVLELGNQQPEAIRLYRNQGYAEIPNYGQYIGMETSICMKKELTSWRDSK